MKSQRISFLVFAWLCAYAGLAYAANSFAQDVRDFDYPSLFLAGAAGMLGGLIRTIFTLASGKHVVLDVLRVSWKDLIVAMVGGLLAYLAIQGWNSLGTWFGITLPIIARDLRMALLVFVGYSRGRWNNVGERFATDIVTRGRAHIRGEQIPITAPAPLEPRA